ncbi:hypothetical protein AJ80_08766 [Polytolypa hystricis UAMH7299]|uniref:Uncharacterized protein n=1 Tax=Polytolypa hystricis (strain UAMH7299) TaxID=1447883 RepID=A0A2B7X222_POLH7|nr:hypothetical protein AJ80_08766 [Polytolypa hystricis UAMH7299]
MAPARVGAEVCGKKRPAEDELEGDQPLTKKFGRLQIGPHEKASSDERQATATRPSARQGSSYTNDSMQLDDTKHTVYIHDLDRELAEIEAQEENRVAFLPDIEKRLMALPKSVLKSKPPVMNELVLYRIPSSLSLPEEQDSVRKAIIESRAREREKIKAARDAESKAQDDGSAKASSAPVESMTATDNDIDVMEID